MRGRRRGKWRGMGGVRSVKGNGRGEECEGGWEGRRKGQLKRSKIHPRDRTKWKSIRAEKRDRMESARSRKEKERAVQNTRPFDLACH